MSRASYNMDQNVWNRHTEQNGCLFENHSSIENEKQIEKCSQKFTPFRFRLVSTSVLCQKNFPDFGKVFEV